jgi:site-specific DNA-methyltransferase (adenine-specific)
LKPKDYLEWSKKWIDAVIPKLKNTSSFYIFLTWQHSPEIFSYMKTKMIMINEIIWEPVAQTPIGRRKNLTNLADMVG